MGDLAGELWHFLGLSGPAALAVVISTTVMYTVFTLVLWVWGDHLRSSSSSITVAVATLIGAIAARVTLGHTPTLVAGLIALGTLLVLERSFGVLRRAGRRLGPHRAPRPRRDAAPE